MEGAGPVASRGKRRERLLRYDFPVIRHIDDVLPHIKGREEFAVFERGPITVVNYTHQTSDTFPPVTDTATAILRECRGLIFDTATGKVKSRSFHKFFNYGEREENQNIDVSEPHFVLTKLDGSMVRPLLIDGGIRWATKMGITDVSMQAETFAATRPEYEHLARAMLSTGLTPIFEWMSRKNRIVLDYPEDTLTLLAIRDNEFGFYLFRRTVVVTATKYDVPVVEALSPISDLDAFVSDLKQQENQEGVVIAFESGHMVKIKTDWYLQLHRGKDQISRERPLIGLILNDKLDDLLPLLTEDDKKEVIAFADDIYTDLLDFSHAVCCVLYTARKDGMDRKTFAISTDGVYSPPIRSACFHLFDEPDWLRAKALKWGTDFILKNLGSAKALDKARHILLTARWQEKEAE